MVTGMLITTDREQGIIDLAMHNVFILALSLEDGAGYWTLIQIHLFGHIADPGDLC